MITYKNEIINTNNIIYIKEFTNAINIYFIGGTNHWIYFDNEVSKMALLTSIKIKMN